MEDLKQIQEFFSKPINESQFKDLQIGDKFLRFGKNGQLWKKTSEKQAEFIKNVGKKTAKYDKKAVNEGKLREFELELINKNGKRIVQKIHANPETAELFDIIANLKKSPNIKDVKIKKLVNEEKIEVDKDTKFQLDLTHLLDKHVVKEIAEEVMKEKGYSKYLESPDNPKGETPGLTDKVLSKILMRIGDEVKETIELGKNLNEELCAKGKAYIKKRKAAGEKSSAYLSGRAVKVCKGQMKG